ncbi:formylglycine-generating enzyme family protein [Spirosoma flavum]|uniref:Formylglycine-generating enzyme family protein n=1 Tax=Spirosoma flavum TaxID=2048557 RepID=A0ABW6AFJ1_9BACT
MKQTLIILLHVLLLSVGGFAQQGKKPINETHKDMALISARNKSFLMGWNKEEAGTEWACFIGKHKVSFTYDFYMDSTLVTQADYQALMHKNRSAHKTGNGRLPVEKVTWYEAVLYCNERSKRDGLDTVYTYSAVVRTDTSVLDLLTLTYTIQKNGYRLPTNAEYEYTERATSQGTYFFADTAQNINEISKDYAWSELNANKETHPVATKKPHPWGLYDLIGNVFEWCSDWEGPYPLTDQIDPVGPPNGKTECGNTFIGSEKKVAKGGSYKTDVKGHMRINYHFKWPPATITGEVGFRCVATKK